MPGNNGVYKFTDSGNFLYPHFRNRLLTASVGDLTAAPSASTSLKISFLNSGVGTQYTFSGSGASGYAWNPAVNDSTYAGYAITYFSSIPQSHRTMSNNGAVANWGGGAITTQLSGVGVSYSGVLFADNITTYQVTAGTMVSSFVLYRYSRASATGSATADTLSDDAQSLLIAYFDCATGMPVSGNGGDITVVWDTGVNKIFKI